MQAHGNLPAQQLADQITSFVRKGDPVVSTGATAEGT